MRLRGASVLWVLSVIPLWAQPTPPPVVPGTPPMPMTPPPPMSSGSTPIAPNEIGGKTLDEWIALTNDADPSVRDTAFHALPNFGPAARPKASPALLAGLKDGRDIGPRVAALMAVSVMGFDEPQKKEGLGVLLNLLKMPASSIRAPTAVTLAAFGTDARGALPDLILHSRDQYSWEVRRACVFAIGRIGYLPAEMAADPIALRSLGLSLSDPALPVRHSAYQAIMNLGPPKAAPEVQLLLGNLEARVVKERDPHLNLWVRLGMMRFNKALVTDANLTPIAKQLKNADPAVQTTAAQILGTIGPDAKGKVPDLLEVLKSQDLIAVGTTIWALGNIGPAASKAVPQIEPFLTHMDESIKKAARTSIDAIQKKPMTPTVP